MDKARLNVSLTIPDAGRFEAVIAAAEELGFRPDAVFATLGIATGSVPQVRLERLRALDGVGSVELQTTFRAVSP